MRRLPIVLLAILAASCAPGGEDGSTPKTVVFFEHASVALDGAARQAVGIAAGQARAHPTDAVTVAGYAAANGNLGADEQLARERTGVVTALLEQDGVNANRIQAIPRPPTNEAPPIAARRVEISVGSGV